MMKPRVYRHGPNRWWVQYPPRRHDTGPWPTWQAAYQYARRMVMPV